MRISDWSSDVCSSDLKDERLPVVRPDASVADILAVISSKRLGGACVVDAGNRLLGLIVDGDIRRLIQARQDLYQKTAADVMQSRPRVISDCAIVADVLLMLQENEGRYVLLPVVDGDRRLQGILQTRSEERRVGTEGGRSCGSRGWPDQ